MPSGYTKADGTVVPSGWDIYGVELEKELRARLAGLAASGTAPAAGSAGEESEEEATQLPPGQAPMRATVTTRGASGDEEGTQRQPPPPPSPPRPSPRRTIESRLSAIQRGI